MQTVLQGIFQRLTSFLFIYIFFKYLAATLMASFRTQIKSITEQTAQALIYKNNQFILLV